MVKDHHASDNRKSVAARVREEQEFHNAGSSWAPMMISPSMSGVEVSARSPLTLVGAVDMLASLLDAECDWHHAAFLRSVSFACAATISFRSPCAPAVEKKLTVSST